MDRTIQAVALFDKLAALYQAKYMDVGAYGESFKLFCDGLPQNASILELACGPGNITKFLLGIRPDLDIYGTDLSENMIDLAKQNNPTARFGILDSRDISKLENQYHGVMCGFCLPYLSKGDAISLIADSYKKLHSGGVLYISTMEGNYADSRMVAGSTGEELFMHFHQADYLTEALEAAGFSIIRLERQTDAEKNATDLIIVAQK